MHTDSYTVHYEILGPTTNKWFSFVREVPNVSSLEEAQKVVEDSVLTENRFKDEKGAITVPPTEARIIDINLRRTFKEPVEIKTSLDDSHKETVCQNNEASNVPAVGNSTTD